MARPAKPEPLGKVIRFRATEAEEAALLGKAKEARLSVSAYIRARVIEAPTGRPSRPRQRKAAADITALSGCLAQLGKIGGNLNQIAKQANMGGGLSFALGEELAALAALRGEIVAAIEGKNHGNDN